MSRLPIRLRLTLVFAIVMTAVLSALGAFLYVWLYANLGDRVSERLETRREGLAALVSEATTPRVAKLRIVSGAEGFAQVLRANGAIVVAFGPEAQGQLLSGDELRRAREGRAAAEKTVVGSDREPYPARVLAAGARTKSGDRLVVLVGESLEDRNDAVGALLIALLAALPVALLVSAISGYVVAGAALRPMEAMRRRASEISSETSAQRLPLPAASDEVRRLGETLNAMLDRLDEGLERERRFVADASHELRTPLALLQTELELALRQPRTAGELELSLRSASEETDRLVRLAEDLLLVARSDRGKLPVRLAPEPAGPLLERVAARFRPRAESAGRRIEVGGVEGLELEVDGARVQQALGNLVDNALRHGTGTVRVAAASRDGAVEIHVSDEGPGFAPEFIPHAFERFSRADDARGRGGTGLGLAIVDAVARAHDGSAHAANRAAGGADVWLTLPRRAPTERL